MGNLAPYPTAEELMARAQQETGLTDFGKPQFIEGLKRYLQSLEEDARLSEAGQARVLPTLMRRLTRRLEIEDWLKKHPEVEKLPILGPVSITGLPRTGTTALANLMSLDPQFRCLRLWEQRQPCPPPTLDTEMQDPRRLAYAKEIESLTTGNPEHHAMHLYEVDATVEDVEPLGFEFSSQDMTYPVFGYHAWWRAKDMRSTYEYHRRISQILQSKRPPNFWLYKAPHHKFHLDAFVHAYPDTRFVFTHRDPAKSVASYVSFVTALYPAGTLENHDLRHVGAKVHEHLLDGMRRAVAAREKLGDGRFVDVYHRDLDSDPLGTLKKIYAALKLEFKPKVQASVVEWDKANHSGAYGVHKYTPEQFGLSADQIRSDYDFYTRKFDVPIKK